MEAASKPIVTPRVRASRLGALWRNAVGRKALMAATGVLLSLFVIVHMLGNLQTFAGAEALNRYGELLRFEPALLWAVRLVLLVAVVVHAVAGVQLWLERAHARPVGYHTYRAVTSSPASRTMIWSGFLILGFVVYHLLDLTVGVANPNFVPGNIYHNVLATFGRWLAVAFYVVAMIALGFHLWHGLWSMFQSLGLANRKVSVTIQKIAIGVAVALTLGFAAVPLAVVFGLVS